ncbi:MAG: hypothetical protein D6690_02825 [Nitrospirae bacterium]|nr:MAG: hypothetical protein D6690_02825 [Nitrospirota bacterium]
MNECNPTAAREVGSQADPTETVKLKTARVVIMSAQRRAKARETVECVGRFEACFSFGRIPDWLNEHFVVEEDTNDDRPPDTRMSRFVHVQVRCGRQGLLIS